MTIWSEEETLMAADKASRLSELLEQEDFVQRNALRWLKRRHVDKFLATVNAEESAKLLRLARGLHYQSESNSAGFPFLDWLWVIDPNDDWKRQYLKTTDEDGSGRRLVARLAELNYDWVGRWWQWRCAKGHGFRNKILSSDKAVIDALNTREVEGHFSVLGEDFIAAIIGRKPDLIEALPQDRCGIILRSALEVEPSVSSFIEGLSQHGIPSDAATIIDDILNFHSESEVTRQLNELVTRWQGQSGSDPVAIAIKQGHESLEAFFRSPWQSTIRPSWRRGDDKLWTTILSSDIGRAFATAVRAAHGRFRLEFGYSIGVLIAEEEAEPSTEKISAHLKKVGIEPPPKMVHNLLPMVELWAYLRMFAKYQASSWQHETELIGLRAKIVSLAATTPELWSQSLSWILFRASTLGDVAQAVTLELASSSPQVRASLDNACNEQAEDVRLKALGLRTLLLGLEAPDSGLARTLADAAAHYMDGSPVFPHPLEPISLTWLGSSGIEQAIADGVRRACGRFASEVRDQGADIEEALTKAIVKELEVEFREVQPRLKLLGSSRSRSPVPVLSMRQRPSSKKSEEPIYGCDLAWLLKATVRGRYSLTWVDLVQVKKSSNLQQSKSRAARADSWKIECKQLDDILKWSATAAYWLIASDGEVLVIPAKHLLAIRRGTKGGTSLKTFTVGYHQVRSAAIPMEQYLVDLLIGQWVGTSAEELVSFAQGGNSNIRPRVVVEITIDIGLDNQ